jgi:hypothetical protein
MALLTRFYPYVTVDVPAAAIPSVEVAVRDTCIDFCERTLLLQVDHDPITVIAGESTYEFSPPDGYVVSKIMKMWLADEPIYPVAADYVDDSGYVERGSTYEADPCAYLQKDARSFSLLPTPKETVRNGLVMRVAIKPTRETAEVDDVLYDDYAEIIGYGAKYRLLMSPGKEYSNPQLASAFKGLFDHGMSRARARMTKNHTRAQMAVRLNGGFA